MRSFTQSLGADLKPWLLAARPKTLPISFIPIMVGTVIAHGVVDQIDWAIAVLALLFSIFIQIGTNLVNDALDFKKGVDTDSRIGPKRITQSGLLSMKQVLQGGFFCFALAFLFGIPLIMHGGFPLLGIIIVSICCGYIYTGGPWPLAYHGMGELFVFIFYGLVSTSAVYFLQTGFVGPYSLVAGIQLGLLACAPIAINNLRDISSDATSNKKTLAVRFGKRAARIEIALFILLPYLIGFYWIEQGYPLMTLLPLISLAMAIRNVRLINNTEPSPQYNTFLGFSVLHMLSFGILLVIGYLL